MKNPTPLRRWHVLAAIAALLLLILTADPTDCDGKRCTTSFDTTAQPR